MGKERKIQIELHTKHTKILCETGNSGSPLILNEYMKKLEIFDNKHSQWSTIDFGEYDTPSDSRKFLEFHDDVTTFKVLYLFFFSSV